MWPTKGRKNEERGEWERVERVLGEQEGDEGITPRNCSIRLSGIFDAIDWTSVEN